MNMKTFRIYWMGGTTETIEGKDFQDALNKAGLSKLVSMIDFRVDGAELNYEWDKETKLWKRKENKMQKQPGSIGGF